MAKTWETVRGELKIDDKDEAIVQIEKDLIRTMIKIREEQGLTQAQLAEKCNVTQPVIARMEKAVHSPQIDSLLKILTPLGYTLKIEPLSGRNTGKYAGKVPVYAGGSGKCDERKQTGQYAGAFTVLLWNKDGK